MCDSETTSSTSSNLLKSLKDSATCYISSLNCLSPITSSTLNPGEDILENKVLQKEEPIIESDRRFTLFPIQHPAIWDFYKRHMHSFWTAEEIDLSQDIDGWKSLSTHERSFLENILAFFAGSDGIVLENLMSRFSNEVKYLEATSFYSIQSLIETVHSETYSRLIDAYVEDPERKRMLYNAINEIPTIKRKADWALKWLGSERLFAERLIAFAIVEGVFFCGSFCAIFWMKSVKACCMPGLALSNEFISRDESLHCEFACHLYTDHIVNRVPERIVHNIMREAVDIETEFITKAIPVRVIGMNSRSMVEYVKFVADHLLVRLGYSTIYGEKNPFPFMDMISHSSKANFFEKNVSDYNVGIERGGDGFDDCDF